MQRQLQHNRILIRGTCSWHGAANLLLLVCCCSDLPEAHHHNKCGGCVLFKCVPCAAIAACLLATGSLCPKPTSSMATSYAHHILSGCLTLPTFDVVHYLASCDSHSPSVCSLLSPFITIAFRMLDKLEVGVCPKPMGLLAVLVCGLAVCRLQRDMHITGNTNMQGP